MNPIPDRRLMDTIGDGTGQNDVYGDYSSSPAIILYKPKLNQVATIQRLIWTVQGNINPIGSQYGTDSAMTISLGLYKTGNVLLVDLLSGYSYLNNTRLMAIADKYALLPVFGSVSQLRFYFDFPTDQLPFQIADAAGQYLKATFQGNMATTDTRIQVIGMSNQISQVL